MDICRKLVDHDLTRVISCNAVQGLKNSMTKMSDCVLPICILLATSLTDSMSCLSQELLFLNLSCEGNRMLWSLPDIFAGDDVLHQLARDTCQGYRVNFFQGTHSSWKKGKMANIFSLQRKLREFDIFRKFRENSGNFSLWKYCAPLLGGYLILSLGLG